MSPFTLAGCWQIVTGDTRSQGFGTVLLVLIWAVFNLAIVPVAIVVPFKLAGALWRSCEESVSEAGEMREVEYAESPKRRELSDTIKELEWRISSCSAELKTARESLHTFRPYILDERLNVFGSEGPSEACRCRVSV